MNGISEMVRITCEKSRPLTVLPCAILPAENRNDKATQQPRDLRCRKIKYIACCKKGNLFFQVVDYKAKAKKLVFCTLTNFLFPLVFLRSHEPIINWSAGD
jgi:hypothetical protein